MTTKAKTKVGIYTLTRDADGDVAVWPTAAAVVLRRQADDWWDAESDHHELRGESPKERELLIAMFPAIRKGTRARVRVTVEVIDERR